jgi:PTH1 family peptidyl-tRNA hydrolase
MKIIVGLGNPGKKFEKTRHNLGFLIIENLKLKIENFSDWRYEKKFKAEISRGKIGNKKIILAKPQTFMNNSGKSVKLLVLNSFQKPRQIKAMAVIQRRFRNLWVIHDDIDLTLGKIRISIGRGSAGHKGVQSIIDELGTKDFVRFRIGINRFAQNQKSKIKNQKLDEFVLKKFNKGEEKILKGVIKKTCQAIEVAIKEGIEKAMSRFNC